MGSLLAFRLYGLFQWPVVVDDPPQAPVAGHVAEPRAGLVEIYFAEDLGDASQTKAFLRWLTMAEAIKQKLDAVGLVGGVVAPPPDAMNVFTRSRADLKQDFEGDEVKLWIFDPGYRPGQHNRPTPLVFAGAMLFEQFPGDGAPPDVVWPLFRACKYQTNADKLFSRLLVGQFGNDNFRFDLQIPTPYPQTSLDGPVDLNPSVFAFSALFAPRVAPGAATKWNALVLGRQGHNHQHSGPLNSRLGQFGFSAFKSPSNNPDFAELQSGGLPLKDFWPVDSRAYASHVAARLGLDSRGASDSFALKPADQMDLSLRFRGPEKNVHGRLIYRISVDVGTPGKLAGNALTIVNGKLQIRLTDELGGSLLIAPSTETPKVFADLALSWKVGDPWDFESYGFSLGVSLNWGERIYEGFLGDPARYMPAGFIWRAGLVNAAATIDDVRESLVNVEGAAPLSSLPHLMVKGNPDVRFVLVAVKRWDLPTDKDGSLSDPAPIRNWLRLSLATTNSSASLKLGLFPTELKQPLLTQATFSSLWKSATPDALPLEFDCDDAWINPEAPLDETNAAFFASFSLRLAASNAARGWRLGALQFDSKDVTRDPTQAGLSASDIFGYLKCGGPGVAGSGPGAPVFPEILGKPTAIDFQLPFAVDSIVPEVTDEVAGDVRRQFPLLIPLNQPSGDAAARAASQPAFWFNVRETVAPTLDWSLSVDILRSLKAQPGAASYVLLSQEPFSVMRFEEANLAALAEESDASVATYSSSDRVWKLKQVADRYHYTLPPQVVGESMDKPRRLEIFDLTEGDDGAQPYRPFDDRPVASWDPVQWGDLHRRPIEFRLSPSAEIWLKPSDVPRSFYMAQWDAYGLFRQHSELGLGAALGEFRGEFLYGLSVGVDVSRESGAGRLARVAEIEALTGRVVGQPANESSGDPLSVEWAVISGAIARRPERLEIWTNDPDSPAAFPSARFADGVSFALRETALLRAPVAGNKSITLEDRDHFAAGPVERKTLSGQKGLRYHPQGLSGGALWPVESTNLFTRLCDVPESKGGSIESIALSSIGGDAAQSAKFLDGIVTIISETRNGYVERQRVEVIGRIGALWHRAKHVVVYARTASPSEQFQPEAKEDPNARRSRRPILRKVSEYVELLQWERSYPDFTAATQRHAGFLDSVRFNSRRINVDSAWSEDVGDFGWQIPLWNRSAARRRPQVYPMPDIAFLTTSEGDGDKPVSPQECRDPDKLYFFSDFKSGTDDTDAWQTRLGIDLANAFSANALATIVDQASATDPTDGARRRSVDRVLPGLNRFTWRLAPASRKTALNAGRASKPIYVSLDSVSFMRSGGESTQPPGLESVFKPNIAFPSAKDVEYWSAGAKGAGGAVDAKAFQDALAQVTHAASVADAKTHARELAKAWSDPNGLSKGVQDALSNANGKTQALSEAFKAFQNFDLSSAKQLVGQGEEACAKLKSDAVATLRGKSSLVIENIKSWISQVESVSPSIKEGMKKDEAVNALTGAIIEDIRPLFKEASADIARADASVESVRAIVGDVDGEIEALFARARKRLSDVSASYDRGKPWSQSRRDAFQAALKAAIDNVSADVEALIDEARRRFAVEVSAAGQAVAGQISKLLQTVDKSQLQALNEIVDVKKLAVAIFAPATKVASAWIEGGPSNQPIAKAVQDARGPVAGSAATPEQKRLAIAALDAVDQARKDVADGAATLQSTIQDINNRVSSTTEIAIADVKAVVDRVKAELQNLEAAETKMGEAAQNLADCLLNDLSGAFKGLANNAKAEADRVTVWVNGRFAEATANIDATVDLAFAETNALLDEAEQKLRDQVRAFTLRIDEFAGDLQYALKGVSEALKPESLAETALRDQVIEPALTAALSGVPFPIAISADTWKAYFDGLDRIEVEATALIKNLSADALNVVGDLSSLCSIAGEDANAVINYFDSVKKTAEEYVKAKTSALLDRFDTLIDDKGATVEQIIANAQALDYSVRAIQNDLGRSVETAHMLADRVLDAVANTKIDLSKPLSVPSSLLKLYSAVSAPPEIAALKSDIDRIRSNFDQAADIIGATRSTALFNHLGDELKALGLSIPFDKIGEGILPADLSNLDIGKMFSHFGGANLGGLLDGFKVPQGVADAVRVMHDFDKAQARAWVQVDIDAPMPGRRTLFSLEVFEADLIDMRLTGKVRVEASKDSDTVTETGFGRLAADLDMVAGGQSLVTFQQIALNFSKESGLKVDFDPSRVRLNPGFRAIQDFLSTLFPDELGGLKVLKSGGIPVGLEHQFSMPPISLMFGTSGISNISISNAFRLLAYPDFIISDKFSLSRPELPFIFSIFVIGGTGYISLEASYQPFDHALAVTVEAGIGGSASIGFAFGPFSGEIFIALSATINYRKVIGRPGGGLTVGALLVIVGSVSVCGIVTIGIYLVLAITYRDNGQADANGSLTVTITISRFFKIHAGASVHYKLRGGRSETTTSTSVSAQSTDPSVNRLMNARG